MINKAKLSSLITRLEGEKAPSISVIVPTYRQSRAKAQNPKVVRKALTKAKAMVKAQQHSNNDYLANSLIDKLDALEAQVDFLHAQEGIGFFVSSTLSEWISFPFKVSEKIVVGDSFEVRDLHYYQQYATEYHILLLSKNGIRLFSACMDEAEEIKDSRFPKLFEDTYEYAKPAPASSMRNTLQSFERDKSQLKQIRQKAFIKELDIALRHYLEEKKPIIISGVIEEVSLFKNNSSFAHLIEGEIIGNYNRDLNKLVFQAWKKIRSHKINHDQTQRVHALKEDIGKAKVVTGIRDVWNATKEGKGLTLYVEKDFTRHAYLSMESAQLYLKPPKLKYKRVEDIVDDTIELALTKGTNVHFLENDKLKSLGRIALTLRYLSPLLTA